LGTEQFSLLIGIGATLGLLQVVRRNPQEQSLRWVLAGLSVLAAGLVGARANFVLLHLDLFASAPLDALRVNLGGLSWPGALLLGLIVLGLVSLILRVPFGRTADGLMPVFTSVAVMAWLGCGQSGCAYGGLIPQDRFWALRVPDEQGVLAYRWPLQLVAAASLLLLVWRVDLGNSGSKRPAGWLACSIGLVMAVHTLVFSSLRADSLPVWRGIRLDMSAACLLAAISLFGLTWLGVRKLRVPITSKMRDEKRASLSPPRE
jgi:prolipoprotein diacylglyceryltransferase